jgi:hypothetical protein
MDGAMTKAPLGGKWSARIRPTAEDRHQTERAHRRRRHAYWPRRSRCEPQ